MISIVYTTNRKENKFFEWFLPSLISQIKDVQVEIILVDYWCEEEKAIVAFQSVDFGGFQTKIKEIIVKHIRPLPSYCQGKYKLTQENWFSATVSRNTAMCHAKYKYLAFADDLSVLSPTWLDAVIEACNGEYVVQGTYRKDKNMVVENGVLISSEPSAHDHRSVNTPYGGQITGHPEWSYGCSLGMPLELALEVNGYDELCSITGYEDCNFGIRLGRAGARFIFDTRMLTIESEELHHTEGNYFKRVDPETTREKYYQVLSGFGIGHSSFHSIERHDASHIIVDCAKKGSVKSSWNQYNLRSLRDKIQTGERITKEDMNFPLHWWFDDKALNEM